MGGSGFEPEGRVFRAPRKRKFLSFFLVSIATTVVFPAVRVEPRVVSAQTLQDRPADLADILERCVAYGERLSGAILDFVCLERIEETYLFATSPPLIRSMTEMTQADYKFFTVETGVTLR